MSTLPAINNHVMHRATHGVFSRSVLLERGRKGNRRHHSHRRPLLRLLTEVNGFCGERFESRAEAGEQAPLLVWAAPSIHCNTLPLNVMYSRVRMSTHRRYTVKPSNGSVLCARPSEPISAH